MRCSLCVACCMLSVVRCSLNAVCLFVVCCCSVFDVCGLVVICWSLFVVCCLQCALSFLLFVFVQGLIVGRCWLRVVCCRFLGVWRLLVDGCCLLLVE